MKEDFSQDIIRRFIMKEKEKIYGPRGHEVTNLGKILEKHSKHNQDEACSRKADIEAYFLGSKGENIKYFTELIEKSIHSCETARLQFQVEDSRHITREIKNLPSFLEAQDKLDSELNKLLTNLRDLSPPFYSSRYYGHMNWENTIPSMVGYFAGMLYNPNNTAFEGSPYTTLLQIEVMKQFAEMFSLPPMLSKDVENQENCSWGHLTCGGTVANLESIWAARNCRFLALSIRKFIESCKKQNKFHALSNITVTLPDESIKNLLNLSVWEILNIDNDEIMHLYDRAFHYFLNECNSEQEKDRAYDFYRKGVESFSIGKVGLFKIYGYLQALGKDNEKWKVNGECEIPSPILIVSGAKHYSIPKSLSVLGFGQGGVEKIPTDEDSRMDILSLREKLEDCLEKNIPVLHVVAIVGTTEEGTVDNIEEIVKVRKDFAKKGLYFHLHIDGAYGAYFCSLLKLQKQYWNSISPYTAKQLSLFDKADSITFDPHKTGYVPYSCGGIIYRNHRLRDNLNFSAPYIYTGTEPNMAIYGVQGSKPGASVTSVYLSLAVLPLIRSGHGQLLQRTMVNTKIFCSSLYQIEKDIYKYEYRVGGKTKEMKERFYCYQLSRRYTEKYGEGDRELEDQAYKVISETYPMNIQQVVRDDRDGRSYQPYYLDVGPDTNIVCYGLNFEKNGKVNTSLKEYNRFNAKIIEISTPIGSDISVRMKDLYLSQTELTRKSHGDKVFEDYLKRHNLQEDEDHIMLIRSTIMNAFFTQPKREKGDLKNPNGIFIEELKENACEALLLLQEESRA